MDAELTADLLASIEAGRLVVVCGAGLSMAPPSSLPSAKAVAQACFDAYMVAINPDADRALRDDLEELAQHFVNLGTLKTVFIDRLVPWKEFVRPANPGHAAVADFLITGATFGTCRRGRVGVAPVAPTRVQDLSFEIPCPLPWLDKHNARPVVESVANFFHEPAAARVRAGSGRVS